MRSRHVPEIDLLRVEPGAGYPSDYLVARLAGRRRSLVDDLPSLIAGGAPAGISDKRIWDTFLTDLTWLHRQMPSRLRTILAPVLGLFELKTIVLCLHARLADADAALSPLLEHSLLADDVKEVLRGGRDVAHVVSGFSRIGGGAFATLDATYAADGLRGFEDGLMRLYLQHATAGPLHPRVRAFFRAFIDGRNAMLLYKHLRWAIPLEPQFISGGSIARREWTSRFARRQMPRPDAGPALETTLLASLTRQLDTLRRDGRAVAVVLAYTWRLYIHARNLAVAYHGGALAGPVLQRELVP